MLGLLPVVIEGLNDRWSVQLLERNRPWPNHRALPVRGGRAYAELDWRTTAGGSWATRSPRAILASS